MVYDDDTGSTQFNDITDDDLQRRRDAREKPAAPPEQLRRRIIELARKHPDRDAEQIYVLLRAQKVSVALEVVRAVVTELRRAGRRT